MATIRIINDRIKTTYDEENMTLTIIKDITQEIKSKYNVFQNMGEGTIYFVNKNTDEIEWWLSEKRRKS